MSAQEHARFVSQSSRLFLGIDRQKLGIDRQKLVISSRKTLSLLAFPHPKTSIKPILKQGGKQPPQNNRAPACTPVRTYVYASAEHGVVVAGGRLCKVSFLGIGTFLKSSPQPKGLIASSEPLQSSPREIHLRRTSTSRAPLGSSQSALLSHGR